MRSPSASPTSRSHSPRANASSPPIRRPVKQQVGRRLAPDDRGQRDGQGEAVMEAEAGRSWH